MKNRQRQAACQEYFMGV